MTSKRRPAAPNLIPRSIAQATLAMTALIAIPGVCAAAAPNALGDRTSATQSEASDTEALAQRLKSLYADARIGAVSRTPLPGLYEAVIDGSLMYAEPTGRYLLSGHIFDLQTRRDLTAERKQAMERVNFEHLPLHLALREVRGTGARTLVVFSDPDCPYCRRLEEELRDLTDITIHTFLMPLRALHPEAHDKSIAVWCSRDPLAAWRRVMRGEAIAPARADCEHPMEGIAQIAEELGIRATPTLIAADGRKLNGLATRQEIEIWLTAQDEQRTAGASR